MATYHVAKTGNDANPGTLAQPFQTLAKGITVLTAGDTLYIRAGTWGEAIESIIGKSGTASQPITIAGYPGERPVLAPINHHRVIVTSSQTNYWVFRNMVWDGINHDNVYDPPTQTHSRVGNTLQNSTNLVLDDLEIKGWRYNGLWITGVNNLTIRNCDIHDLITQNIVGTRYHGIYYHHGTNAVIESNDLHHCPGYGIQVWPGLHNGHVIRNNKIRDNHYQTDVSDMGGLVIGQYAPEQQSDAIGPVQNIQVYNNLIYRNVPGPAITTSDGLRLIGPVNNISLWNNNVYGHVRYGIALLGFGSVSPNTPQNIIIRNNILFGNQTRNPSLTTNYSAVSTATATLSHNLDTMNPLYVNAGADDFQVQSGSPAINAGITVSAFAADYLGVARPQGAAWDIGAYEKVGATYYVALTGNDAAPGTISQPWATLQKAITVLQPGDTLYLRGGTYPQWLNADVDNIPSGTSETSRITLAGYPGETVVLQPGGLREYVLRLGSPSRAWTVNYWRIMDIILDGTGCSPGTAAGGGCFILWTEMPHPTTGAPLGVVDFLRLDNVTIRNSPTNGYLGGGNGHEYNNLYVHHNGLGAQQQGYPNGANGLYCATLRNSTIRGGLWHDNLSFGLRIFNSGTAPRPKASNNIVENAVFHTNGQGKAFGGTATTPGGGGLVIGDDSNTVRNCVIYNNRAGFMFYQSAQGTSGTKCYFNTIYGNDVGVTWGSNGPSASELRNTVMASNITDFSNAGGNAVTEQTNWRTSQGDPLFVNPAIANFHLRAGSPLINGGTTIASVPTDAEGDLRSSPPDIGADEFVASADVTPPVAPTGLRIL